VASAGSRDLDGFVTMKQDALRDQRLDLGRDLGGSVAPGFAATSTRNSASSARSSLSSDFRLTARRAAASVEAW
jgi:hypothetical protein